MAATKTKKPPSARKSASGNKGKTARKRGTGRTASTKGSVKKQTAKQAAAKKSAPKTKKAAPKRTAGKVAKNGGGTRAERREALLVSVLKKLKTKSQASAAQLGLSSNQAYVFANEGFIKAVDSVQTGKRGRPAVIYKLADKGRKRASRLK